MTNIIYNPDEISEQFYKKPASAEIVGAQESLDFNKSAVNNDGEVFNLQDVDDKLPDFEPLPARKYECEVESTTHTYSKKAGKAMLEIRFRVNDPIEYQNRVIFWRIVPSSSFGLTRLKQFISRLGLAKKVNMASFNLKEFAESGIAIGKECVLSIGVKSFTRDDGTPGVGNIVKDIFPANNQDFLVTR